MAKIKFENGVTVNFEGNPTPQDVEEVALKLNLNKTPSSVPEESSPGLLDRLGKGIDNTMLGAAKGLGSTVFGAAKLLQKGSNLIEKNVAKPIFGGEGTGFDIGQKPEFLNPVGTGQKIGYGAEQVGEFLVPFTKAAKVGQVATQGGKLAKMATTLGKVATEAGISGAEFAGKTAIQTGGDLGEVKRAGIIGAITPPAMRTAGAAIKAVSKPIGDVLSSVIATMIGKSPEHIKIAFSNPVKVAEQMAQKRIPEEVRTQAVDALKKYKSDYGNEFEKGLDSIKKTYPYGKTGKILVQREMYDATKGIPAIFRKFRVAVTDNGKALNFDKLNSAIVKGGEQKNLEKVYDTIINQKDFSVQGVQDVAARINALSKFEEGAKTQTSAVISGIHDSYSKAIDSVYPELGKLRSQYKADSNVYQGIESVVKSVKNEISDPTAVTGAIKKLSNLFKEDNEAYLRAVQRLEQVSGVDLINGLVASEFRQLAPASFGSRMAQAGLLSGAAITSNPMLLLVLPLFSPRVEGKIVTGAGKLIPKASNVLKKTVPLIPKAAVPLTR
jgi:hypothetical protein